MKNVDIDKTALGISTGALGFFLAGLFSLNNAIIDFQIRNWVLLIVGSVLSLYGVILLLNLILRIFDRITNTIRPYLVICVLSIGGAQLAIIVATYGTLLKIMSIVFLLLFIYVIIFTSRSVFQNRGQLWTIFVTLLIIALIQFFLVDNSLRWDRWDLYFVLLLELIIISLIIRRNLKLKRNMVNLSNTQIN